MLEDYSLPDAITQSADPKKMRAKQSTLSGCRLRLYECIFVPAEIPTEFNEPLAELVRRLNTKDPVTAAATLAEAESIFNAAMTRATSAEARATALQGTVAIASSLVIAGAGLLLDATRITERGWRVALLSILVLILAALIGCAWRAISVTGRMFEYEQPGPERIHLRAALSGPEAQTFRAAELLRASGVASEIAAVKVGLLRSASWWLKRALALLLTFVIALGLCAAVQRGPHPTSATRCVVPSKARTPAEQSILKLVFSSEPSCSERPVSASP